MRIDGGGRRVLLISNSTLYGSGYLDHAESEIRDFLGADSLAYLSLQGLLQTVAPDGHQFCAACFTGDYPERPPSEELLQLELF